MMIVSALVFGLIATQDKLFAGLNAFIDIFGAQRIPVDIGISQIPTPTTQR